MTTPAPAEENLLATIPLRDRADVRVGAAVLVVALASRLLCLAALAIAARHHGVPLASLITKFDGAYYRVIATSGYPHALPVVDGSVVKSPIGFFPLFPLAVKAVMAITGLGFATAAVVFNTIAAAVAALVIYELTRSQLDRKTAFVEAALWLVWPIAFVLSLAYAEALFTALAAGCLWALLRQRWVWAGALAALAAATRPTGLILMLCCAMAAYLAVKDEWSWRPLVAPVLAPLGAIAYLAWLWDRTGRATAWFVTESQGWHVYVDGGIDNLRRVGSYLSQGRADGLGVVAFVGISLVLLVVLFVDRAHPVLLTYATGIFLLAVMSRNDLSSVPRFLFVAFPLLMPIAARTRNMNWYLIAGGLSASALAMAGVAVYITTTSHYPP